MSDTTVYATFYRTRSYTVIVLNMFHFRKRMSDWSCNAKLLVYTITTNAVGITFLTPKEQNLYLKR